MTIGAGELRERVTFQARGLDGNGAALGDYADGVTRWARVRARFAGESVIQARLQGQQPVEVAVRSDSDTRAIDTTNRLLWNGAPYEIASIAPTPDRAFIIILATAAAG